jgi:arylsulfatase A-like enzyme
MPTRASVTMHRMKGSSIAASGNAGSRREGGMKHGGNSYEALIRGDWKILRNDPFSPYELYHIGNDPQETKNLATTNREKFEELATAIRHHIQRGGATPWQSSGD